MKRPSDMQTDVAKKRKKDQNPRSVAEATEGSLRKLREKERILLIYKKELAARTAENEKSLEGVAIQIEAQKKKAQKKNEGMPEQLEERSNLYSALKSKVILMRHGHQKWNKDSPIKQKIPEQEDTYLTDRGKEQILKSAKQLAQYLKQENRLSPNIQNVIICSDMLRAKEKTP